MTGLKHKNRLQNTGSRFFALTNKAYLTKDVERDMKSHQKEYA